MIYLLLSLMLWPGPPAHKFHVTYGRLAVEDTQALLRIRFFHDDLEATLAAFAGDPAFRLAADPHSDSLFTRYFNRTFVLAQDGHALPGRIVSSGEDMDGRERVWWYLLRFDAPAPLLRFTVSNRLLFEAFGDQKNIFKVMHLPGEQTRSYYFVDGADHAEVAFEAP